MRAEPRTQSVGLGRFAGLGSKLKMASVGMLVLGLAGTGAAEAEIIIKTLPDGTQMVYNQEEPSKKRRSSQASVGPAVLRTNTGYDEMIRYYAVQEGLSPRLVQAVVQVESSYNPRARSKKGAMGLMQLMPETARELGVRDPWDPSQNISGGTRYLRQQIDRFGDLTLALAAYNAGPTAVQRYRGVPPYAETERYVQKVLALYQRNPPEILRAQARDDSRRRQESQAKQAAAEPPRGDRVYVTRDENNRIIFSTARPGSR